jgi:putative ABC transport system permease protein
VTGLQPLVAARMRPGDVLRVGAVGLRTRPMRAFLSALGVAIGIAAMVAVVGISSSSRADLDRQFAALGTNLLTVTPGNAFFGEDARLPVEAPLMIARIEPVTSVTYVGAVADAHVYRNDRILPAETGGITVQAADLGLLETVAASVARGAWLNAATARYPTVVLGAAAANRLGVGIVGEQVYLAGQWFTVGGVLRAAPLAPDLDTSALVGWPAAQRYLSFDGHPTRIYTRSRDASVESVRAVLGATANPDAPNEVDVSRPSDALQAQRASDRAFTGLLLGLGAVALLVGGVGIANTMVISVLERRAEIGLRRSLGATRRQIRSQFLAESLLLAGLGGAGGVTLGILVTAGYAMSRDWPTMVPAWATAGGIACTLMIGAMAGLYPAIRASWVPPTEALATA